MCLIGAANGHHGGVLGRGRQHGTCYAAYIHYTSIVRIQYQ
jgi:hypothetical protein